MDMKLKKHCECGENLDSACHGQNHLARRIDIGVRFRENNYGKGRKENE
jgi:hypothetical protein